MLDTRKGFYTDLDTLFDTRYGTLLKLDKSLLKGLLTDDLYHERLIDEFGYINTNLFSYHYNRRNKTTLALSPITKVLELMLAEALLQEEKAVMANEIPLTTITINTYPYTLTDDECNAIGSKIKLLMVGAKVEIAFINIHAKEIILDFINSTFSVLYLYNYNEWLDYQIVNNKASAESVKLYVPALLGKAIKVKKEEALEDMFNAYSEIFGGFISITHIPVEVFSARYQHIDTFIKNLTT